MCFGETICIRVSGIFLFSYEVKNSEQERANTQLRPLHIRINRYLKNAVSVLLLRP